MSPSSSGSDASGVEPAPGASECCAIADASQIADARRHVLAHALDLGFSEARRSDISIALTEAGTNLVKHGGGGEFVVRCAPGRIEVLALDNGSGRNNIEECMRDGYSTGASLGLGLGAMRRLATHFDIYSHQGLGAIVAMEFAPAAAPQESSSGVSLPVQDEKVCGDAWDVLTQADRTLALIADGLGHGPEAHRAATEAVRVFRENQQRAPGQILELIHNALRSTRGAAVAVCEIVPQTGIVRTAGVGNCALALVRPGHRRGLVSMNGTAGQGLVKAKEFSYPWQPDDTLILHTDGLITHWDLDKYPGLLAKNPGVIAGALYRDFTRGRDDVTVVAIRIA